MARRTICAQLRPLFFATRLEATTRREYPPKTAKIRSETFLFFGLDVEESTVTIMNKHTPMWGLSEEYKEEAGNPGPEIGVRRLDPFLAHNGESNWCSNGKLANETHVAYVGLGTHYDNVEMENARSEQNGTDDDAARIATIETINVTSANSNKATILASNAHIQILQEISLTDKQRNAMRIEASKAGKTFIGGPPDLEHFKTSAAVGFLAAKGLSMYPIPTPTKAYEDAYNTGRCLICCFDIQGVTCVIANIC